MRVASCKRMASAAVSRFMSLGMRHRRCCSGLAGGLLAACLAGAVYAQGVYQEPRVFLDEVFSGEVPPPKLLWVTNDLRPAIREILGHDLNVLRIRYWSRDGISAWILEEVGKEEPITTGIVVRDNRIERIKVLIFRESRGWEVRYPFFTDQFDGAGLADRWQLDRSIDGVSGATLSVTALTKLARLALFLHQRSEAAQG